MVVPVEKFGEDKQRLNQEMMNLYKTEKVNPAAGCLPILVQIRSSSRFTRYCSSPLRCDISRSTAGFRICRPPTQRPCSTSSVSFLGIRRKF